MTHYMNLWDDSFQAIKEGWKTVEMRLNDEKRSIISVGDIIEFTNTTTQGKMACQVVNIYKYANFVELYMHHDKVSIGYKEDEEANPDDMLLYYTREDIEKYGVVGIELSRIMVG
ncbi:ASC-1 homology (ASCH) domain-containing protein [Lachnospiraceae bacterium XBB1006]|nr:ASC-1 homology (ASCH) domain-containing protein [Lachnospiraceae bacterium XBB1006]